MTPEDKQFVREMYHHYNFPPVQQKDIDGLRILTLLIEAEAMREKAETFLLHRACDDKGCFDGLRFYSPDARHKWSDADWIAVKRKELVG